MKAGLAYLIVAVAAAVAAVLDAAVDITVEVGPDFVVFAVLYIVAQATERLVEPVMQGIKRSELETAKKELKAARGTVVLAISGNNASGLDTATTEESAKQKELDKLQQQRAIAGWALASAFALVVCGVLGLGLIEAVSTVEAEGSDLSLFRRVDVILTGLAVGAGTKPLHDVISRLEKAKQNADPATKPATTV